MLCADPTLAPSADAVARAQAAQRAGSEKEWRGFERDYRREMHSPEARHALELLSALSHHADLGVGCYCEEEAWCHRRVLRELLQDLGAAVG